jgi:uncharacterized protein YdeI (YjbR/CyaY-like superfamily)
METYKDIPVMSFATQHAWHNWLSKNYTLQTGIWLKIAKKGSGIDSVDRKQALDEALCYGWIDGQALSLDQTYYLQKYTPRRVRSMWSKVNIGKVEALIAEGRMQAQGMAEIERAKADGRWDAAYDPPSTITVPSDLQEALNANPKAKAAFDALNKTNRFAILWRMATVKTPAGRANRMQKILEMLEQGKTFH